ncbi:uncharacterized protein ACIQIH_003124 isoform 2-T3 [Cyanocitta cristata]
MNFSEARQVQCTAAIPSHSRTVLAAPQTAGFFHNSAQASEFCLTDQAVAARIGAAFAQCFVPGIPRRAREREKTGILVFFREITGALRRRSKSEFVLHTRVQKKKVTLLLPKKKIWHVSLQRHQDVLELLKTV